MVEAVTFILILVCTYIVYQLKLPRDRDFQFTPSTEDDDNMQSNFLAFYTTFSTAQSKPRQPKIDLQIRAIVKLGGCKKYVTIYSRPSSAKL